MSKEILKLFSKRFSVDVAEGGKIKKHHKFEFIFSEVVSKFQEFSYFDQHLVTTSISSSASCSTWPGRPSTCRPCWTGASPCSDNFTWWSSS